MKGLTILGATGTIGVNTLDVAGRHRDRFSVVALTAHTNDERLAEQCRAFHPRFAVMSHEAGAARLRDRLGGDCPRTEVLGGGRALEEVAAHEDTDYVMAGIVGAAGLLPTLAAARAGKRVLLANKEALVMSGQLFMDAVHAHDAELLPIDSEHNAIFQCMPRSGAGGVERIVLTGSGGPFRRAPLDSLPDVTPEQAVAHPNWVMGRKISVDSATMMNKGLEFIEACWLFDTSPDRVEVVIHPQSVIHSMVSYVDGSVLAQLGQPDMRTPIAHALAWPERVASGVDALDFPTLGQLDFEPPDLARFPCLGLGMAAARDGGAASAVVNAANEIAVERFLEGRLRYTGIAEVIEAALSRVEDRAPSDLATVLAIDAEAREVANEESARRAR